MGIDALLGAEPEHEEVCRAAINSHGTDNIEAG
jgi:hypothetical protein